MQAVAQTSRTQLGAGAFAVQLGAEQNAELERQTSQDTTTGPTQRRGERGAAVADIKIQAVDQRG
jgi:membrane protein